MDYSLPSSTYGIFQARILEWDAISYHRGSSRPRDWTHISWISCIGRWILYHQCHLGSPLNSNSSESENHSVVSDSLWHHGLYSPWSSPGKNTGVGSLLLLQGIFPTQGWNPGLLHCRWILYQLSHKGSPIYIRDGRGDADPLVLLYTLSDEIYSPWKQGCNISLLN